MRTNQNSKVLWVVGAGSGMGRAAALDAAKQGWHVFLSGRREQALLETRGEIRNMGGNSDVLPLDVTDFRQMTSAADAVVEQGGRLDAVVIAAGVNHPHRRWSDQTMESFTKIVETNLIGTAATVNAALPALRKRGGSIVLVSSYSAWAYSPKAGVAYGASKTALGVLSKTINTQEAAFGVRACHLCPGDVATDFLEMRPEVPSEEARRNMLQPADVGRIVSFVLDSPSHVRIDELVVSPLSQIP